jgi:hypothetical protein
VELWTNYGIGFTLRLSLFPLSSHSLSSSSYISPSPSLTFNFFSVGVTEFSITRAAMKLNRAVPPLGLVLYERTRTVRLKRESSIICRPQKVGGGYCYKTLLIRWSYACLCTLALCICWSQRMTNSISWKCFVIRLLKIMSCLWRVAFRNARKIC